MKRKSWFVAIPAIIIAAKLGLADVSFAQQGQGMGMGRRGQVGQGWGQGNGPGYANCPNYPGYRQGLRAGDGTGAQARRGRRWTQNVNPPASQTPAPETTQ